MFAGLFKRAEASVDNAIGDLGNRVIIAIPFLTALGFAAASLTLALNRTYGPELGNLLVAGAFCLLGALLALVLRVRRHLGVQTGTGTSDTSETPSQPIEARPGEQSIFDDETLMAVVSSAAPIIIPAVLRAGLKNWPVVLAAGASLYILSRSELTGNGKTTQTNSGRTSANGRDAFPN